MSYRILTIDPGSTSTKIGVFDDEKMLFEENLHHSAEELAQFETIPQQEAFRRRLVLKALEEHHIPLESLSAVCGRGGVLKPVHGGTYLTTDAMIDTLKKGPYGHHASNLGGLLAREIGSALHIPSYIVDPPVVDELAPLARYSGHPLITRRSIFHALNQKAVAKRYAKEVGKKYEELNLIVCHMGGGVSVGAHVKGSVVDTENALDGEGPFSPEFRPSQERCRRSRTRRGGWRIAARIPRMNRCSAARPEDHEAYPDDYPLRCLLPLLRAGAAADRIPRGVVERQSLVRGADPRDRCDGTPSDEGDRRAENPARHARAP